ncbi:ewing's tumor-associated antigen 1 isoform X2 [Pyxicephalus adspersus]|uniref:ewing's tumor-associated antigen 1 isoform X2 n=1 Tax=Pyxicephalus adspersus TaxID=30357 RepID=UPI003B5AADA6
MCMCFQIAESSSNKRTPQFLSKCKPWDINSPSRDGEQHNEIFWDPNSPTCFKLEKGKKKTANKCIVEISDIVNRIAPKDGTPTNSEASYLGVWIGEDAIPCTPVVTRTRTKLTRSRILKTEEELMELAKQLDRNLVEHKDQNDEMMEKAQETVNVVSDQADNDGSFLEFIPEEEEIALALKAASQSSGVGAENGSQKSVDQEAEEALNALFDCATQKFSGRLSQGLLHVSTSSIQEFVSETENATVKNHLLTKDKVPLQNDKSLGHLPLICKVQSNTLQCKKNSQQAVFSEKEPVKSSAMAHSASNSQDDFEDDWGDDILEDDSFVMQITQNPELIATPKINLTSRTTKDSNLDTVRGKDSTACQAKTITSNKPNHFKFAPQIFNQAGGSKMKTPEVNRTESSQVKTIEEHKKDRMISSAPPPKPSGVQATKPNITGLKSSTSSSSNTGVSKTYTFSSKPFSSKKEKDEPTQKGVQAVQQTHAISKNKESVYVDEWDDPKFSDEVLDMFCKSDSLWEGKDDDDDLLYQVCDDVERLTQVQEGNTQLCSSSHNFSTKSGLNNKAETLVATNSSHVSNKFSGNMLSSNKSGAKGVSTASVGGNSFQNSSFQRTNPSCSTFSRSNSLPSEVESKKFNELPSQFVNNSQTTTASTRTTHAPSKYSFTKTKPSQSLSVHTNSSFSGNGTSKGPQGYVDSNKINTHMQPHVLSSQQSSIKRHFSESTIHSSKVFVSEDRSKKCSMEEIERKKQEALARRKMREKIGSYDKAPT